MFNLTAFIVTIILLALVVTAMAGAFTAAYHQWMPLRVLGALFALVGVAAIVGVVFGVVA